MERAKKASRRGRPAAVRAGSGSRRRKAPPEPESPGVLARALREHGLRATGPRLAILAHLRSDLSHPTPEGVHAALRQRHASISLSTVYQTLESFLEVGLCRRISARARPLRVDGTTDDHDHAVCRSCGGVLDLPRRATAAPRPIGLPAGTELLGVRIEYEVVCAACAAGSGGRAGG